MPSKEPCILSPVKRAPKRTGLGLFVYRAPLPSKEPYSLSPLERALQGTSTKLFSCVVSHSIPSKIPLFLATSQEPYSHSPIERSLQGTGTGLFSCLVSHCIPSRDFSRLFDISPMLCCKSRTYRRDSYHLTFMSVEPSFQVTRAFLTGVDSIASRDSIPSYFHVTAAFIFRSPEPYLT